MPAAIPAAIIGSAAIGAIASSNAADDAASAQENAANKAAAQQDKATQFQQEQLAQTRANLQPYVNSGGGAATNLQAGTTGNGEFNKPFTMADLMKYKTPGYEFTQQQGEQALNRSLAAQGRYGSGAATKSLTSYATGLANQTAQDAFNNYNTDLNNRFNRLSNTASLGENAASGLGSNANSAAGNIATSTNASGNYGTQAGNASAAGSIGSARALTQPLSLSTIGSLGLFKNPLSSDTTSINNSATNNFSGGSDGLGYQTVSDSMIG